MALGSLVLDRLIPGGVKDSDHVHIDTDDGTCSRCRLPVPDDEVPIILWNETGEQIWIYCDRCLAGQGTNDNRPDR